jgi:hypothetical protein
MTPQVQLSRLKERLTYDPITGILRWLPSKSIAGYVGSNGYSYIRLDGRNLLAHRVAWVLTYGEWPTEIDHINRIKSDNRLVNLREVSSTENKHNMGMLSTNRSGIKGVHWYKRHGMWRAQISIAGKTKHLGYFDSISEAAKVYEAVKESLHV